MRIVVFLLLIISLSGIHSLNAQSCGCDKTITASSNYLIDGSSMNIKPGDTICIMSGTRTNLTFRNLAGAEGNPIVIINCGGKAIISSSTSYGMKFERSHHFKITGTGSADTLGIEVKNSYHGIYLGDFTTNFEIDHVDIHDIPFAGIMAKTDPVCTDTNTWRQNFTMKNIFIHHNYIHNTVNGEGMYIGYSFYANGIACGNKTAYPHAIENIKVYNNRTVNTGCEGIQVGCATKGCEIYNNKIEAFGQRPFAPSQSQQNGIQIGEGTGGLCYSNIVIADSSNRGANGIIVLGIGDNLIYNNTIVYPALCGLFLDERPPALISDTISGYWIINNTIINPGADGIKTYAELVTKNEIKNNIIVNPGSAKYINTTGGQGVPVVTQGNNYFTSNIMNVKFVNPGLYDFHLQNNSPCIDMAENAAHWNIFKDQSNLIRPKGIAFDIGAFEFDTSLINIPPNVWAGNDTTIYYPLDSALLSGTVSDPDGVMDTYFWNSISPDSLLIRQPGSLQTIVKNLKLGANTFQLTGIDNGNKYTQDLIVINVIKKTSNAPIVYAGKDTTAFLPIIQISLSGSVIDSSNTFQNFRWKQIGGSSNAQINDSTSLVTFVSGLHEGQYSFRLTVDNGNGVFYYDDLIIVVDSNNAPVVNAGLDKKVSNRVISIPLNGTASDIDGSVVSTSWSQTHGFVATILNSSNLNAQVSDFNPGSYTFKLSATDNMGASNFDVVNILVNHSPVANAGNDVVVSSLSGMTITGTGNDLDGDPVSYFWSKVSGPRVNLSSVNSATVSLTNLTWGIYTFRLKATDSLGDFTNDDVVLIVNRAPTANAGSNRTINVNQAPIVVSGTGTDSDGTIVAYNWTKISGPSVTMTNTSNSSMTINNLQKGSYVFQLTVTDNYGTTDTDNVTIKVR